MSLSLHVKAQRDAFELDVAFASDARAIAIVGPSGAGKTTLLMSLAGLAPADEVSLKVDDVTLVDTKAGLSPPARHRRVGYVFQDGRLFPHLSVAANVGFARPYAADPLSVAEALSLVDLEGFEERWPRSLSGGEARRVAIARALVARPRLLLLDEPFSGLDARRRDAMISHLLRLRDEAATPMVVVSHDARDVEDLAHGVLTLDAGRRVYGSVTPPVLAP